MRCHLGVTTAVCRTDEGTVSLSASVSPLTPMRSSADARFGAIWTDYYPAVLAYARRRAPGDVAADVATAAFAVLWRRIEDPPAEPLPWLYAVARRELANQLRGERRRRALGARLAGRAGRRDRAEVSDAAEGATESLGARAALARMRAADREVLMLVAWEGLDVPQAAAALGITPAAFAVRLHRARRRLESQLTTQLDTQPDSRPPRQADTQADTQPDTSKEYPS